MATKDDHARYARENEDVAKNRLGDPRIDADRRWCVTALFYAALHWVEAYLAARNFGGYADNHTTRMNMIKTVSDLRRIHADYRLLTDRGWEARYKIRVITTQEVADARSAYDRIRAHLEPFI